MVGPLLEMNEKPVVESSTQILNFDGDFNAHNDGEVTCKQTSKTGLHVLSPYPCPSPSLSKFIIVSMVTDHLMDRLFVRQC